jgi:hypothetical protein
MSSVMNALRQTVSRGREAIAPRDGSRSSRLRLWIGGEQSHMSDAKPAEPAKSAQAAQAAQAAVPPAMGRFDFAISSIVPPEPTLVKELVAGTSSLSGPIIEIGTLVGLTTTLMAMSDQGQRQIITVDNYCWNPWGLTPEDHRGLAAKILLYLSATGRVQIVDQDKNAFFASYDGPTPSLVFLDAIHDYPETSKDIAWARDVGAAVIAGHDYSDAFPGVVQAVDEAGGPRRLLGSVWAL